MWYMYFVLGIYSANAFDDKFWVVSERGSIMGLGCGFGAAERIGPRPYLIKLVGG